MEERCLRLGSSSNIDSSNLNSEMELIPKGQQVHKAPMLDFSNKTANTLINDKINSFGELFRNNIHLIENDDSDFESLVSISSIESESIGNGKAYYITISIGFPFLD